MFDEILKAVKEHFADNPQIAADIPADQHDAVHNEVAQHVANQLSGTDPAGVTRPQASASTTPATPAMSPASAATVSAATASTGGLSGMLEKLKEGVTSGNPVVTAIEGGLVSSLASKFGLGSAVTGAIAASLPGLLQKFAGKTAAS